MADRRGDWIQTYTGRMAWPLDPRPEDICIEDIAHSLALQCRYAGHTRVFYSVAEHSVRGLVLAAPPNPHLPRSAESLELQRSQEREWLLHDAAEAYLVDLPRPLKRDLCCAWYKVVEEGWQLTIAHKFGCSMPGPKSHFADAVMLATEMRDLMAPPPVPWREMPAPLPDRIDPWSPWEAERRFLAEFHRLFGADHGLAPKGTP